MQSRGFFTSRRANDESSRNNATPGSNGDIIRNDHQRSNRIMEPSDARNEAHRYARPGRSHRERVAYSRNACSQERSTDANYLDRGVEMLPRRPKRRDYTMDYEDRSTWRDVSSDLNISKPILRNGISHGRSERLYSSTLPRRSRTINFRDQCNPLESRRGYPKSLQDLTDLEVDDRIRDPGVSSLLPSSRVERLWRDERSENGYRRRRYREDQLEDDYLRLYRNLSRLDKYSPGGRYEPGQVHYERECRTFGKDTVAFIYYKTCYL